MNTITLEVKSYAEAMTEAKCAIKTGEPQNAAKIVFTSPELLWKVLTAKRWDLLKIMRGRGVVGVRELARLVNRGVKGVHNDITALVKAGVIKRSGKGIEFPYDVVKVDFTLSAHDMLRAG